MKAAIYVGGDKIEVKQVANPAARPGEVVVKVYYAGICGSDLYMCSGKNPRVFPPVIPGHEFAGEVVSLGSGVQGFIPGDQVAVFPLISCGKCYACRQGWYHVCEQLKLIGVQADGGFAELVAVPEENLIRIPGGLSMKAAALVEPMAVAAHCVAQADLKVGDVVAVCGAGPIGLMVAAIAKAGGASKVVITDFNDHRLGLAEEMGCIPVNLSKESVEQTLKDVSSTGGADVVFECVGYPSASRQVAALARIKGQVVVVGLYKSMAEIDLLQVMFKELTIRGSRVYRKEDYYTALDLLVSGKVNASAFISDIVELEGITGAFEALRNNPEAIKILVRM